MRTYVLRRVMLMVPLLLAVSIVVFAMVRILPGDVATLMVAGGQSPMFTFRENDDLHRAIRHFYEAEKPVAAYCHGVAALVDLKLSDGSYLVTGKNAAQELYTLTAETKLKGVTGLRLEDWRR